MPARQLAVTLRCRCDQLFDLAADIERYPDYLPGWQSVRMLGRVGNRLRVEQRLGLPLFAQPFVSTARLERPEQVLITSDDGPFRRLHVEWRFVPLAERGCRVTLSLDYELKSRALAILADRLFALAVDDVIARFTSRAKALYGCQVIVD